MSLSRMEGNFSNLWLDEKQDALATKNNSFEHNFISGKMTISEVKITCLSVSNGMAREQRLD